MKEASKVQLRVASEAGKKMPKTYKSDTNQQALKIGSPSHCQAISELRQRERKEMLLHSNWQSSDDNMMYIIFVLIGANQVIKKTNKSPQIFKVLPFASGTTFPRDDKALIHQQGVGVEMVGRKVVSAVELLALDTKLVYKA